MKTICTEPADMHIKTIKSNRYGYHLKYNHIEAGSLLYIYIEITFCKGHNMSYDI